MKDKQDLLLINHGQFGYKAGYYYYAKYLKPDFNITILCQDKGLSIVELKGVDVKYVSAKGNKIMRKMNWMRNVYVAIKSHKKTNPIFMTYSHHCSIFGLLFLKRNIILDIRTGSVKSNKYLNLFENKCLLFETLFFQRITILSAGLRQKLSINKSKCNILPLGSDVLSNKTKSYNNLNLLYVGSLTNRNITETIQGLSVFIESYSVCKTDISYDIFGFGTKEDTLNIQKTISDFNLSTVVKFHGRKKHSELVPYFDKCTIGISYVPLTPFFEFQPPTKTFEYILSGLICLATDTYENRQLINQNNGELCLDTPQSFSNGLYQIYSKRGQFQDETVRKTLDKHKWADIVQNNLALYLNSF